MTQIYPRKTHRFSRLRICIPITQHHHLMYVDMRKENEENEFIFFKKHLWKARGRSGVLIYEY